MNIQQFDLSATTMDDGAIRLTQRDYSGEDSVIDIHPAQLRHLADRLAPAPDRMTKSIQRRLLELQSDIGYFTDQSMWIDEIAERISDGLAFQIGANAMRCAINRIVADMGLEPLDGAPELPPDSAPPAEAPKPSTRAPLPPPKAQQQGQLLE